MSVVTVPYSTVLPPMAPLATIASFTNMSIFNRIYVGSIQFELTEKDLEAVFSTFGPIRSIAMMLDPVHKRHRGYGFIEFETPEAAALAQSSMDNAELGGRHLRVGRPQNFPSELPLGIPRPLPNRIYVANVHELVQEQELRPVFEAFGPVRYCHLSPDLNTRQHRGFGFVEFENVASTISAINSLHGFELAGRPLRVGKTIVGGEVPPGMDSIGNSGTLVKSRVPTAVLRAAQQINASLTGLAPSAPPASETGPTSTILVLRNLEDYSTIEQSPALKSELEEDVYEECIKFGTIIRVLVHADAALRTVKVFVEFSRPEEVGNAIRVMHHRWFGGKQLVAEYYDQARFLAENYNS